MTDTELTALTILVQTNTLAMLQANEFRLRNDFSEAYTDLQITENDEVILLSEELKRRGVIK